MLQFKSNIILKCKIEALTGIHIGVSKEKFEIGGIDSYVIRDPNTNFPYIPGSSIKGKMRSLLAFSLGKAEDDPSPKKKDPNCPLQRIFGSGGDEQSIKKGPTRLIIRDAFPDKDTIDMWEKLDSELLYTENKSENTINRITSKANPRFIERIVKGSKFNVEFIFSIYDVEGIENDINYLSYFIESLRFLEHSSIGGSGSRGYGRIAFKIFNPFVLNKNDYKIGSKNFQESSKDLDDLLIDKKDTKWWYRLSDIDENFLKNNIISKIA